MTASPPHSSRPCCPVWRGTIGRLGVRMSLVAARCSQVGRSEHVGV
jgi:hypothetical protein